MGVPVVMPQLGLTMTEGSVSEWLKKPGEFVRKGDMLFIVSTDKADMEVESLDEGKLAQIVVQPGNVVPVGTVIAYLGEPGAITVATPQPVAVSTKAGISDEGVAKSFSAIAVHVGEGGLPASPRARKLAREMGVDISKVLPSGGRQRIVEDDVRAFASAAKTHDSQAQSPELRRRRLIAERLTQSVQTIPHFSLSLEVRADRFVTLRENLKTAETERGGLTTTMTDLLLKALGLALNDAPAMLRIWDEGNLSAVSSIDLGMAIAAESGVVAPIVRNVATLDIAGIARWRHDAMEKTRTGRLALKDLEGGIGTLSNLGVYRVDQFQAIITPGQSFILAVGKIDRRPWVEGSKLVVAQTLKLTLSVDHRVADGAVAAQFLQRIAELIENPDCLPGVPT